MAIVRRGRPSVILASILLTQMAASVRVAQILPAGAFEYSWFHLTRHCAGRFKFASLLDTSVALSQPPHPLTLGSSISVAFSQNPASQASISLPLCIPKLGHSAVIVFSYSSVSVGIVIARKKVKMNYFGPQHLELFLFALTTRG